MIEANENGFRALFLKFGGRQLQHRTGFQTENLLYRHIFGFFRKGFRKGIDVIIAEKSHLISLLCSQNGGLSVLFHHGLNFSHIPVFQHDAKACLCFIGGVVITRTTVILLFDFLIGDLNVFVKQFLLHQS